MASVGCLFVRFVDAIWGRFGCVSVCFGSRFHALRLMFDAFLDAFVGGCLILLGRDFGYTSGGFLCGFGVCWVSFVPFV